MLTKIEKLRSKKGFSLMELMIVIVIIGILAAGSLIIFGDKGEKAKQASTKDMFGKMATFLGVEMMSCSTGDTTTMNGNLTCEGRDYQSVVDAIIATFSDLEHVYIKKATVVTDGGSYSNNATKNDSGSKGYIRLQSPYNPKTWVMIGTCYRDPCYLSRDDYKYLENKIQITS